MKEEPDGSNWGGEVERWIKAQGFNHPVYWCGVFVSQMFLESGINNKYLFSARAYDFSKNNHKYNLADVIYGKYKVKSGDLLVRKNHVQFVFDWDKTSGETIGGNESNSVRKAKSNIELLIRNKTKYVVDTKGVINE